ncbi:MAG: pyridoxamine 5'-phosphate oxidase [Alphaproteobacteria bacterium]
MKTNNIFSEYGNKPLALFGRWFEEAVKSEPADPDAMALGTVGADGRPHVRVVLLRDFSADGFVFYTNYEGGKGGDLAYNKQAEANFYWKSLGRQVRISGAVEKVSAAESDTYFASRARGKQIGAWASAQSQAFDNYEELARKTAEAERRFEGQGIPRPPHWGGYKITPERMEFWIAEKDRLHTRFVYIKEKGAWKAHWLYP